MSDHGMPERGWSKVFEVGVQRTGTSSLGQAFRILGLKTKGWDERLYWQCIRGGYDETLAEAERYEAFEDLPWDYDPMLAIFDQAFPNAKFIVLTRDEDEWVASYEAAFGIEDPGFARLWRRRKYQSIRERFAQRPGDLLEMNIADGWDPLCQFLDLPAPDVAFPHTNVGSAQGWGSGRSKRLPTTARRRFRGRRAALQAVRQRDPKPGRSRARDGLRVVNPFAEPGIVVVASSMRTGSTLLCGLAASLPEVESTYEALNSGSYGWMGLSGANQAADLIRDLSTQAPVTVTKVFQTHLSRLGTTWHDFANELPTARWVLLYRHDIAARFVSKLQAEASGAWTKRLSPQYRTIKPPAENVTINFDELSAFYDETVRRDREAFQALELRGLVVVAYEDIAPDPAGWAKAVLPGALGLSPPETEWVPVVDFVRTGHQDLRQRVTNPEVLTRAEKNGKRWHPAASW